MIGIVTRWILTRVGGGADLMAMAVIAVLSLGGVALIAKVTFGIVTSIREAERARFTLEQVRQQAAAEKAVSEANARAERAAEQVRNERLEMDRARTEIAEMEEILRQYQDDPIIYPHALARELRK
jgi:biopolymer transport protein ExbB/TolQ